MQLKIILKVTLVLICLLFLGMQMINLEFEAAGARVALLLLLTLLYYLKVQTKKLFFFLFLLCFSIAEILVFSSYIVVIDYDNSVDYFYYSANGLYILSYLFLMIRILSDIDIRSVLKKYWMHILILLVLDVFCVVILSETTIKLLSKVEFSMEFIYNTVIMLLLTTAMINYISKNSQKSMNLLLGAIFIFFSEVIQMTYFYISSMTILNVLCSLFLVLAFLFFYLQARTPLDSEQQMIQQDLKHN